MGRVRAAAPVGRMGPVGALGAVGAVGAVGLVSAVVGPEALCTRYLAIP